MLPLCLVNQCFYICCLQRIVYFFLCMKKLRLRKLKGLAQSPTVAKAHNQNCHPALQTSESHHPVLINPVGEEVGWGCKPLGLPLPLRNSGPMFCEGFRAFLLPPTPCLVRPFLFLAPPGHTSVALGSRKKAADLELGQALGALGAKGAPSFWEAVPQVWSGLCGC